MPLRHPRPALLIAAALTLPAGAALAGPVVELSASASRPAANDLLRAQLYVEASAPDAAEVARRLNRDLGDALQQARQAPRVTVRSGNQHAYPVFNREQKIEGWRMRGELQLEASDAAALSAAVTPLQQQRVALAGISQQPSPATRRQAEEGATEDALRAFETRAAQIARALGKSYRIRRLSITQEGGMAPMLRAAPLAMAARDAAPVPLEAGDSQISVSIHGEIELSD